MKPLHPAFLTTLLLAANASAFANGLADPTRPPQGPRQAVAASSVRVEAILHSEDRRLAIVNGKVVHAGDHVAGVRIEEILADGVRYVRDGRSQVARLRSAAMPVRREGRTEAGQ